MDAQHFDALTRALSAFGSRRRALGLFVASVLGLLAPGVGASDEAAARKRRKKRRHRKKCKRKSGARICAGKCGIVKNKQTCKKKVNCGPCVCDPPCAAGQVCQPNGVCACEATTCRQAGGCCAGTTCQPVDFQSDPQHCGDCQTVCLEVETCLAGSCCADPGATDDLQSAIDGTPAGATLTLCAGAWSLSATVSIAKDLTLAGAGAGQTTLEGPSSDRVLKIEAGAEVTLQDLTVTGGHGGIDNAGTLTLSDVTVSGNTISDGSGGGISNTGTLTLAAGTLITGNHAADGGGIFNNDSGTVTLENDSRVINNTASTNGAGINNDGSTVTVQSQALVCSNTGAANQCAGAGYVGNCPNPGETCPPQD